jgi:hypothetical protein
MSRFILILLLLSHFLQSQEDKGSKFIHVIGGGPQLLANNRRYLNAEYTELNYTKIGYSVFYKILLQRYSRKYVGITLRLNHREGNAKNGYTGLSSNNETKGCFSLFRADIGGELGRWVGKRGNFFIGTGIYFGKIISSVSSAEKTSWYINSGSHTQTLSDLPILTEYHVGVSFEVLQQIKLFKGNYLLTGVILQLESREVYKSRIGAICNVVIGYKFGKNSSLSPSSSTPGDTKGL